MTASVLYVMISNAQSVPILLLNIGYHKIIQDYSLVYNVIDKAITL